VHFAPFDTDPRPGDVVTVTVTRGAPHYLLADHAPLAIRRTRAGDASVAATGSPAIDLPLLPLPAVGPPPGC
jgi:tRNA-2-methylthio-N6-dimethylallyladenosine synthase